MDALYANPPSGDPCADAWPGVRWCTCGQPPCRNGSVSSLAFLNVPAQSLPLAGSLPTQIGRLGGLQGLEMISMMERQPLSGTIPTQVGLLTLLRSFDLRFARVSGTLPSQLGRIGISRAWPDFGPHGPSHDKGGTLSVYGTFISGSVPTQIGQMTALSHLQLFANRLSGSLPITLAALRVDGERNPDGCLFSAPQFVEALRRETGSSQACRQFYDFCDEPTNHFLCPLPSLPQGCERNLSCEHSTTTPPLSPDTFDRGMPTAVVVLVSVLAALLALAATLSRRRLLPRRCSMGTRLRALAICSPWRAHVDEDAVLPAHQVDEDIVLPAHHDAREWHDESTRSPLNPSAHAEVHAQLQMLPLAADNALCPAPPEATQGAVPHSAAAPRE